MSEFPMYTCKSFVQVWLVVLFLSTLLILRCRKARFHCTYVMYDLWKGFSFRFNCTELPTWKSHGSWHIDNLDAKNWYFLILACTSFQPHVTGRLLCQTMYCYYVPCTAEVIVNYLSSHVLLVHNEVRQREIITVYNEMTRTWPEDQRNKYAVDTTLPDDSCEYLPK